MSDNMKPVGRSIRATSASVSIFIIATTAIAVGAVADAKTTSQVSTRSVTAIHDGIVQTIRLMFTGSYRYQPPGRTDHSEIRKRILPSVTAGTENLPLERAAFIPNKLDFRIAPNALTARPQTQPSITDIVPLDSGLSEQGDRSETITEAVTASLPPLPQTKPTRPSVPELIVLDPATRETAAAEPDVNRTGGTMLAVIDSDIALAGDLMQRLIVQAEPKQAEETTRKPETTAPDSVAPTPLRDASDDEERRPASEVQVVDPTAHQEEPIVAETSAVAKPATLAPPLPRVDEPDDAQHPTIDANLLFLPEELAPTGESVKAGVATAVNQTPDVVAALPVRNPKRTKAALAALRRKAARRARRVAAARLRNRKKTPKIAKGGLGDNNSGPRWARKAFVTN